MEAAAEGGAAAAVVSSDLRAAGPRRRSWASCVSEGLEEAAAAAVAARHRPLPLARLLAPVTACRPSWKGLRGACSLIGAVPARPEALHVPLKRAEASIRRRN